MCEISGASVQRLEALGVRVRLVYDLAERAIYFQKFRLAVLDHSLTQAECDEILSGIRDEVRARRALAELHRPA